VKDLWVGGGRAEEMGFGGERKEMGVGGRIGVGCG